jgi:tetratricopeptide (TPR) repeat protein
MKTAETEIRDRLSREIGEGWALLPKDPAAAEAKARIVLEVAPGLPDALLLSGRAAAVQGRRDVAQKDFLEATRRAPDAPQTWRALADFFVRSGNIPAADEVFPKLIETSINEPRLREAATMIRENRIPEAERILKPFLKIHPNDVAAIRMLAEIAARIGRLADAESLLRRAVDISPSFANARFNLATVINRLNRPVEAIAELETLLAVDPDNAGYLLLKGAALGRIGEYDEAIAAFEKVLVAEPEHAHVWMSYAHTLKTIGRQAEAITAYRNSLKFQPTLGEAWWSLANLKTVKFSGEDVAAMAEALDAPKLSAEDRYHLHFAIGKAHEDRGEDEAAFRAYAEGNRLRRATVDYREAETTSLVDRSIALFTPDFFTRHAGQGSPARDPIFVLGLPRSGSTLIEQILASHPEVEGTQELAYVHSIARQVNGPASGTPESRYPNALEKLDADAIRKLGDRYLELAGTHRKSGRPFFVDKMPNNWSHIGMIQLMLPKATIIDARRHPIGCCFSNFKQHFARGQAFTYSLEEIGRYYVDYVRMMAHFDAVTPGRVHRVFYEAMIDDTEGEVRRLLDHVGVPFDPACLAFHKTERPVRTASSEQVRQPIFREGLDQWQRFEAWLDPLKAVLGDVLTEYPAVPVRFAG